MSIISLADHTLSPPLTLARSDHQQLARLALVGSENSAETSDDLLYELDRAEVVDDQALPPNVVRMGSRVHFRTGRDERHVTLVWPADADIATRKISVLTPVGTALIGLRAGQSISFRARDGRPQLLTIIAVLPPESDEDGDDPGPRAA